MPLERISQGFKDISLSFQINPLTRDIIAIKNETAIARSLRNLVETIPGERPFSPILGSRITRSLFENIDEISASSIQSEIENTINNYEQRVQLISTVVTPNYDEGSFDVIITYNIIGIDVLPQQLSFALQSNR
jgi:phage baseplate assembly protein W